MNHISRKVFNILSITIAATFLLSIVMITAMAIYFEIAI